MFELLWSECFDMSFSYFSNFLILKHRLLSFSFLFSLPWVCMQKFNVRSFFNDLFTTSYTIQIQINVSQMKQNKTTYFFLLFTSPSSAWGHIVVSIIINCFIYLIQLHVLYSTFSTDMEIKSTHLLVPYNTCNTLK